MGARHPHPSGRPIRRPHTIGKTLYRVPRTEYETPRLNERSPIDAIGFGTTHLPGHQDGVYEDDTRGKR